MVNKMKFNTGNIYMTRGIANDFEGETLELKGYLKRHFNNDCDCKYKNDIEANEEAIEHRDGRVLSVYNSSKGKIYIITECMSYEPEDRITTILYADEY